MIKISVDDFSRTSEEYLRKNMLSLNASSYCIFDWENRSYKVTKGSAFD